MGHNPVPRRGRSRSSSDNDRNISFRNPPEAPGYPPALSAPIGHRSILAEVRAPLPPRPQNHILQPHQGSATRASFHENAPLHPKHTTSQSTHLSSSGPIVFPSIRRETMSRGNVVGRSVARMDAFTWLSNVKVGERRGSSGSGPDSASASRPTSGPERQRSDAGRRSDSRSRVTDERREGEGNQSLQDECVYFLLYFGFMLIDGWKDYFCH